MNLCKEVGIISSTLDLKGVPYLIMKGRAYEPLFYPEHIHRTSNDIDIIVPSKHFTEVYELFSHKKNIKELNASKHAYLLQHNQCLIDLHKSIQESYFGSFIEWDELWAHRQTIKTHYGNFYTFSKEHHFLVLLTHGAKHQWCRLHWIMDVVWFMLQCSHDEVEEFFRYAHSKNLRHFATVAYQLASSFLPDDYLATIALLTSNQNGSKKIAESFLFDLVRERVGLKEKLKNTSRYLKLIPTFEGKCRYLFLRTVEMTRKRPTH